MKLKNCKTYNDVLKYAQKKGYENLTDEDIAVLVNKINQICDEEIEKLEKRNMAPEARNGLIFMEKFTAASKIKTLYTCTPERRRAIQERVNKAIENVRLKEGEANEKARSHILF